jgi:hypothetical protein
MNLSPAQGMTARDIAVSPPTSQPPSSPVAEELSDPAELAAELAEMAEIAAAEGLPPPMAKAMQGSSTLAHSLTQKLSFSRIYSSYRYFMEWNKTLSLKQLLISILPSLHPTLLSFVKSPLVAVVKAR